MAYTLRKNLDVPKPVLVSGETVYTAPPTGGKVGSLTRVTAASGGTVFTSGAVESVTVKALPSNTGDIYIGFSLADHMPYSGTGYVLNGGESWSFAINDFGMVRVCATVSGDVVSYGGVMR